MSRKIIACNIRPDHNYTHSQNVDFISETGYVTGVMHQNVISANVVGDRITIVCEGGKSLYIYDANTCQLLQVQPL